MSKVKNQTKLHPLYLPLSYMLMIVQSKTISTHPIIHLMLSTFDVMGLLNSNGSLHFRVLTIKITSSLTEIMVKPWIIFP